MRTQKAASRAALSAGKGLVGKAIITQGIKEKDVSSMQFEGYSQFKVRGNMFNRNRITFSSSTMWLSKFAAKQMKIESGDFIDILQNNEDEKKLIIVKSNNETSYKVEKAQKKGNSALRIKGINLVPSLKAIIEVGHFQRGHVDGIVKDGVLYINMADFEMTYYGTTTE